jgi:hypothetical protein
MAFDSNWDNKEHIGLHKIYQNEISAYTYPQNETLGSFVSKVSDVHSLGDAWGALKDLGGAAYGAMSLLPELPSEQSQQTAKTNFTDLSKMNPQAALKEAFNWVVDNTGQTGEDAYATAQTYVMRGKLPSSSEDTSILAQIPKDIRTKVTGKADQFDGEQQVKSFQIIQEGKNFVDSMSSDTDNASDDQAFIYAFAKIMDPASVVREGEYATVQRYAQSWADTFGFNAKTALMGGKFLTKDAIDNMKKTITSRYGAAEKSYDQLRNGYIGSIDSIAGKKVGAIILQDYKTPNSQQMGIKTQISSAKAAGYKPEDIIVFLQKDPAYGSQIQQAISAGYKPEEILNFLK